MIKWSAPRSRRRHFHIGWLLVAWIALSAVAVAQGPPPIPKIERHVTDLTGTLAARQQTALEEKLAAFEARTGMRIAVLIVSTTKPEKSGRYSARLVAGWKQDSQGAGLDLLLLVARDDRRVDIAVGQALEAVLPDETADRITDDVIVPLFSQGDFFGGLNAGTEQIIRIVDGSTLPEPDRHWPEEVKHPTWFSSLAFAAIASYVMARLGLRWIWTMIILMATLSQSVLQLGLSAEWTIAYFCGWAWLFVFGAAATLPSRDGSSSPSERSGRDALLTLFRRMWLTLFCVVSTTPILSGIFLFMDLGWAKAISNILMTETCLLVVGFFVFTAPSLVWRRGSSPQVERIGGRGDPKGTFGGRGGIFGRDGASGKW